MRELQFWDPPAAAVAETFADVTALAAACRFQDCRHDREPGCAVQAALADGLLDAARWASYRKLQREQAYAASREDPRLARAHRDAWKKIHRGVRARMKLEAEAED
jgi:ribosome biogenesis GTPase